MSGSFLRHIENLHPLVGRDEHLLRLQGAMDDGFVLIVEQRAQSNTKSIP
jgi:hypothetical protein